MEVSAEIGILCEIIEGNKYDNNNSCSSEPTRLIIAALAGW